MRHHVLHSLTLAPVLPLVHKLLMGGEVTPTWTVGRLGDLANQARAAASVPWFFDCLDFDATVAVAGEQ